MKPILWLSLLLLCSNLPAADLLPEVLYTQVRVTTSDAGGSGTVIWAKKYEGFYSTFIITCHHVVDKAITVKEQWSPLLQKQIKVEVRQPVNVEFFNYRAVPHGKAPLTNGVRAELVAWDQAHDMALLHVRVGDEPRVARLLPKERIEKVDIGDPVVAVGCALLHDPILTSGLITHMGDMIDYKDYWMSNAQIIFGNSGGAVFLKAENYFFIGIPSRVDIVGWGNPVTHCGYFSPIGRVYDFLTEQIYDFILPGSSRTEAECEKARSAKREEAKR